VGLVIVDHGRSQQTDAGMAVFIVVPGEEELGMDAAILDAAEAVGEIGAVFHRTKLTFRIRIIVGDIRAAVGLNDAEIRQQESDRLRRHG